MNLTVPVYVESHRPHGQAAVFRARPLFVPALQVQGEKLESLLLHLGRELGQALNALGEQARHDALVPWTFYPALEQHRLELRLELRRRTARCRFLFVTFRQFERRLAFTPSLPDLWFDLAAGEALRDRAADVLTRHYRDLEREDDRIDPTADALTGTGYVTPLDLTLRPPAVPPRRKADSLLMLGDAAPPDGAHELRRVGHCLDWLYPEELDRVQLREAERAELARLLTGPEQRPVLLVGPRQVGKTALVHAFIREQMDRDARGRRDRGNVWHVAPQRLISGMSYVGQWESRLLAILKEVRKRGHVFFCDDLLGLFLAGQSGSSSLSVADVLKPCLERRELRFLGEITPEALSVLRERDRGFADLFHLLPVAEPDEPATLRILLGAQRQLEARHRCRFDLDVLPTVLDLQRRYGRDAAFPGKAASFLGRLAVKYRSAAVTRAAALEEFRARSGLALTFLDRQARLPRQEVLDGLSGHVIGQEHAVAAVADVIAVAKARLNDPGRPLAAFLFLGPTGVGKTQCARAVAAYLFGAPERLLRFDLNEYGAPGAAARLVGTFSQPEGLLTAAIRRQPFAVVLFDEVEKAHPEVFDLLLQVLGEGRLTDALGRTADFTSALLILTSNLGVRETETQFGYRRDGAELEGQFVRAAERFFRPEFFNRLDRVLPFRRLTRAHTGDVARKLMGEIFGREGLVQRKCLLAVEPPALERIVEQGYDPVLGARALKRAIERHLTQPVAAQLAALPPGTFTAVRVYPGPDQLAVHVRALAQAEPLSRPAPDLDRPAEVVRRILAAVQRIEGEFAALRPAGPVTAGQLLPEHYRYFALRAQAGEVREAARQILDELEDARLARRGLPTVQTPDAVRVRFKILRNLWTDGAGSMLRQMAAALDIDEYLQGLVDAAGAVGAGAHAPRLANLLNRLALLQALADSLRGSAPERVVLWVRTVNADQQALEHPLVDMYRLALPALHLVGAVRQSREAPPAHGHLLTVDGPHALRLARLEEGLHLVCPLHAPVAPVQVQVLPVAEGSDADRVVADWLARRQAWLGDVARGLASAADDPFGLGDVLRVYRPGRVIDLRTGLTGATDSLAEFLTAALPLPPEVLAADGPE